MDYLHEGLHGLIVDREPFDEPPVIYIGAGEDCPPGPAPILVGAVVGRRPAPQVVAMRYALDAEPTSPPLDPPVYVWPATTGSTDGGRSRPALPRPRQGVRSLRGRDP